LIDEAMNIGEIIKRNPNHNIAVKTLMLLYNAMSEHIPSMQPKTQQYLRDIEVNQRRNILTNAEYVAFQQQLNHAITYEVVKRLMKDRVFDIEHKETGTSLNTDSRARRINFQGDTIMQVNYFLLEFPHYVMSLQNKMLGNTFMQNLIIMDQNLALNKNLELTQADVNHMKMHFSKLDSELQFKFIIYDLLKNSFNTTDLRQFMGDHLLEVISKEYTKIISEEATDEGSFWSMMNENFTLNALVQSDVLGRTLTDKMKKAGVHVNVENITTRINYPDSNVMRFKKSEKQINTKDSNGRVTSEVVNPVKGMRPKIMSGKKAFTKLDVVQIADINQARLLFLGNRNVSVTKTFTSGHQYKNGPAIIMGKFGYINNTGTNWINMSIDGENESRPH